MIGKKLGVWFYFGMQGGLSWCGRDGLGSC